MKKLLILLAIILLSLTSIGQTNVITNNTLIIKHGDITLYLSDDTCTMVSKHILSYSKFKHLGKYPRDNHWFQDTYKGKYSKLYFVHSGYDLGHLTPSSITSYDSLENHCSFSLFNEAPQLAHFNEHPWEQLEMHVEDSIAKYQSDAIIVTGVIYDYNKDQFLGKSKIRIPISYYKILTIGNIVYCWLGSNTTEDIAETDLRSLNRIFKMDKMDLTIK